MTFIKMRFELGFNLFYDILNILNITSSCVSLLCVLSDFMHNLKSDIKQFIRKC